MTRFAALLTAILLFAALGSLQSSYAHCQMPCGIYGDEGRFATLFEHITTIEKAMAQINDLAGQHSAQAAQQVARWVANKESHADDIQHIAQAYFLAQRIKFPKDGGEEAYTENLKLLHQIIVYAMKCKQTVDPANAAKLKAAVTAFQTAYGK